MNEHPHDSILPFVLGALDIDQAIEVGAHLAVCPACRAEAEAFQEAIASAPERARYGAPSPSTKRRLLARLADDAKPRHGFRLVRSHWFGIVAACALALVLVLGAVVVDARRQVASISAQLAESRLENRQLQAQIGQGQQAALFISAPQTAERRLTSAVRRASATIYLQAESAHAVLIVRGLPPAAPGMTYRFWLAGAAAPVPLGALDVGADGSAMLLIDAPAPLARYQQAMVTVEPASEVARPSANVVLVGVVGATS